MPNSSWTHWPIKLTPGCFNSFAHQSRYGIEDWSNRTCQWISRSICCTIWPMCHLLYNFYSLRSPQYEPHLTEICKSGWNPPNPMPQSGERPFSPFIFPPRWVAKIQLKYGNRRILRSLRIKRNTQVSSSYLIIEMVME